MPLVLAALIGLVGMLIVIYPLLGIGHTRERAAVADSLADVAARERTAKAALREVEFDFRLGNLDRADYTVLRARYEERALSALQARYRQEQSLDAVIERELAMLRTREAEARMADELSAAPAARDGSADVSTPTLAPRPATRVAHPPTPPSMRGPHARRRKGV